jgi:hypothetical protein
MSQPTTKARTVVEKKLVRELFRYFDGNLYWKKRPSNGVDVTRPAGSDVGGYRVLRLGGKEYRMHRLIWLYVTGSWPEGVLDHINGMGLDNRISNLRDVDFRENSRNQALHRDSTSGIMGVHFHKSIQKWTAHIQVNNKKLHLGSFETKEEAAKIRKAAEILHGFHKNHGRPTNKES